MKHFLYYRIAPSSVPPTIVKVLISHRIVKNARQADALLLTTFVLCAIASLAILAQPTAASTDITKDAVMHAIFKGR